MELIGPLRVIDAVLVGELNKHVESGTGGEMCVVHCRLGHLVQTVEDWRIFNVFLHLSVVTLDKVPVTKLHFLAEFVKFGVDNSFFIRQIDFRDSMIHQCVLPK